MSGTYPPTQYPSQPAGPPPSRGRGQLLFKGLVAAALAVLLVLAVTVVVVVTRNGPHQGDPVAAPVSSTPTPAPTGETPGGTSTPPPSTPTGPIVSDGVTEPTAPPTVPAGAFVAEDSFDTGLVCTGAPMANATAYDPAAEKVAPYYDDPSGEDAWYEAYVESYDEPWQVSYDNWGEVNVVACMKIDESSRHKVNTCTFTDDDGRRSFDAYSVNYDVTFYEALTGKQIATADEPVPSDPSEDCDDVLSSSADYQAFYLTPDPVATEQAIEAFVG